MLFSKRIILAMEFKEYADLYDKENKDKGVRLKRDTLGVITWLDSQGLLKDPQEIWTDWDEIKCKSGMDNRDS